MTKTAIILGTSRAFGNTYKLAELYQKSSPADIYHLKDHTFSMYDYAHKNINDDFLLLIQTLLHYDHLIFATPNYWYAMSAQMKVFFDRLTDVITIKKDYGRKLRNKTCAVLATGTGKVAPACFEAPFKLTANYLGLNYKGLLYCSCTDDFVINEHINELCTFIKAQ